MKQLFFILIAFFTVAVPAVAQQLKTTRWDSYGVSFKAPSDLTVEDDSSEGYLAGNDTYYLTIQLLEGEGMKKEELGQELKAIAPFELQTQGFAVFALIPIWLYNGRKGVSSKALQYGFYAFYPVHLLVLYLLFTYAH